MNALSSNTPLMFDKANVRSSTRTQILRSLCGSFGLVVVALLNGHAWASSSCINSTYPQTVTASTVQGQTRLTLGKPISGGIISSSLTISGNLVTLSYTYFDACVIVPTPPVASFVDLPVLLPPGDYQLRAIGLNPPFNSFEVTRPFVVQGVSESVTIPASTTSTLVLLGVVVLLVAGASFRRAR